MNELDILIEGPDNVLEGLRCMAHNKANWPKVRKLFSLRKKELSLRLLRGCLKGGKCGTDSRNGRLIQAIGIPHRKYGLLRANMQIILSVQEKIKKGLPFD